MTKKVNYAGCYALRLFVNGEPQVVVVDDYFPFDDTPEKDEWALGHVNKDWEIWVNLIEKAYAKVLGSYEAIEGGKPYQAFLFLTGFPSDVLTHRDYSVDDLWTLLKESATADQPCCCSVNNEESGLTKEQIKKAGLMNTHAYSLIEAKEVVDRETNQLVRVVFIRNPYADNPGNNVSRWNQTSLKMPQNVKE